MVRSKSMTSGSRIRLVRPLTWMLLAAQVLSADATQAPAAPQPAPTRFEVASIRRNPGSGMYRMNTEPGGRFLAINMPLVDVIQSAYDLRAFQLVDVPRWVETERFDILARTGRDHYPSVVALRPLVRTLLAERFGLEVEREQRVMQTYALTRLRPDRLGPQLTPSKADCRSPESRDLANPKRCGTNLPSMGHLTGTGVTTNSLLFTLIGLVGTFVDDETGLTGAYDFTLKWSPGLADDPAAPERVSIFTAVQEQLGLRLEPRRRPVEVIAIKRVERPTEN
jgi:uncharacterized protein (TIGR03435 family)